MQALSSKELESYDRNWECIGHRACVNCDSKGESGVDSETQNSFHQLGIPQ